MNFKTLIFLIKGGAVGLAAISVLLSYRIIRAEQRREHSRRRWLQAGFAFMILSFLVFIGGTVIDSLLPTTLDKRVAAVQRRAARMKQERDELREAILAHIRECRSVYGKAIRSEQREAEMRKCWRKLRGVGDKARLRRRDDQNAVR